MKEIIEDLDEVAPEDEGEVRPIGQLWKKLVKGFLIGASMLIPGVSGGTMAIILDVYDELIGAVSRFRKNVKQNGILLLQYGVAGGAGIVILSKPVLYFMTMYQQPLLFFFMGAIFGSLPPLYRKATISKLKPVNIIAALVGIFSGTALMFLPAGLFDFDPNVNLTEFIVLFLAGIVIAVALVLPGISASYVLLMLGIYDRTLAAIGKLDILFLLPMAVGVLIGTFLTADILERAMTRHPQFTYMMIIGFMLGSLVEVFPGLPSGIGYLYCLVTFASGLGLILHIGRNV